jgi:hypothetical protein
MRTGKKRKRREKKEGKERRRRRRRRSIKRQAEPLCRLHLAVSWMLLRPGP